MAKIEVIMPQMGESITEGTIVKWHKKVGEKVKKDETLLEISTDKVDSEIPSPAAGVLASILVGEQQTVPVQTVIGYLESEAGESVREARSPEAPPAQAAPGAPEAGGGEPEQPVTRADLHRPAEAIPGRFYSPLVLTIARTEGVSVGELETVPGTGQGGRVTKKDILAYLQEKKSGRAAAPPVSQSTPAAEPVVSAPLGIRATRVDAPELRAKYPAPHYEVLQMSNVVQKMADHMVKSVQTSPHVSAVHEVDMTLVVRHRETNAQAFEQREGFKLTFMPYIVDAVVKSIKKYPLVNVSVEGDKIIRKNFIHLGIAVASENGLIVPVIKHAEEKSFLGLARAINDLATRTRSKKLTPDDIQGGTFTISNFGVFGTLIGTPIINQPQVAILGTGAIKKRAVVLEDAIAIRPMAFFTLSFDHRVIDGALGGMFLETIVQHLERFDAKAKV